MSRILHIGNIANNAWQNAKLMNQVDGWSATVICPDYYHSMGTPEWEEADFEASEIADHFAPAWWKIELNGYSRPGSFVQGPLRGCLLTVGGGSDEKTAAKMARVSRLKPCNRLRRTLEAAQLRFGLVYLFVNFFLLAIQGMVLVVTGRWRDYRAEPRQYTFDDLVADHPWMSHLRDLRYRLAGFRSNPEFWEELIRDFRLRFPERKDQLALPDFKQFGVIRDWNTVFPRFDVVQAYATDPIFPMLCGVPYFAFEHGTLRDIPFEDSARGRLTSLAYARAEHVFVTNFDCLENAHQLTGDPAKVTLINHPFDENDLPETTECAALRSSLQAELDSEYLIFFPTRHDWIEGRGYNDKANDELFRAVGRLREEGFAVGLILCDWGHNQRESRELIAELGYERHTRWVAPQATKRFMKYCTACDVVADQFKLGSFGGILFKAMATGTAICTYLNEEDLLRMYSEVPPVINARDAESIAAGLKEVLGDPGRLEELGREGRRWIETHHSGEETVRAQLEQYRKFLKESEVKIPVTGN